MKEKNRSIFILLFLLTSSVSFAQLRSVYEWENRFNNSWEKEHKIALPMSLSNDSWQYYNLAYYIDANSTMYEVTQDLKYLDRALLYITNMIDSAKESKTFSKSQYKDSFKGWVNYTAPSYKNDQKEYPLFESYCWRYVTDLLLVMKKDGLDKNPTYKNKYDSIYNFTINNIYNKWYNRGKNNLYRSNTHMMAHWVKISMNLFLLTDDLKYKVIIDDFCEKYRGNKEIIRLSSGKHSIRWKSAWNQKGAYQDVAHGNAVIDLLIDLYENKLGITYEEILEQITVFDKIIWKSKGVYAKYVDGSGKGVGWFSDGYIKLGRYDKALQIRIENHNKGRTTQFFANGALNAKILLSKNK